MDAGKLNEQRKAIGNKVRELRVARGLSQRVIANQIDMEQKQYWRLEAGENVTLDTLLTILDHLEISLEKFSEGL